jgi:hypothetical protein
MNTARLALWAPRDMTPCNPFVGHVNNAVQTLQCRAITGIGAGCTTLSYLALSQYLPSVVWLWLALLRPPQAALCWTCSTCSSGVLVCVYVCVCVCTCECVWVHMQAHTSALTQAISVYPLLNRSLPSIVSLNYLHQKVNNRGTYLQRHSCTHVCCMFTVCSQATSAFLYVCFMFPLASVSFV